MNNLPAYLIKTPQNVYYFQMRVPKAVQLACGVKSNLFRKSLNTKDERVGIKKSRVLYCAIDDLLQRQQQIDTAYQQALDLLQSFDKEPQFSNLLTSNKETTDLTQAGKEVSVVVTKTTAHSPHTSALKLSDLIEKYLNETKRNWNAKTRNKTEQDYRPKIQLFIDISVIKLDKLSHLSRFQTTKKHC